MPATKRHRRRPLSRRLRDTARAHRARSSSTTAISPAPARPSHYMVPTLIRWPKGLLEAVDAELERRKKKVPSWKRDWWAGPHSRASTIRELVAERLHVSARDGSKAASK